MVYLIFLFATVVPFPWSIKEGYLCIGPSSIYPTIYLSIQLCKNLSVQQVLWTISFCNSGAIPLVHKGRLVLPQSRARGVSHLRMFPLQAFPWRKWIIWIFFYFLNFSCTTHHSLRGMWIIRNFTTFLSWSVTVLAIGFCNDDCRQFFTEKLIWGFQPKSFVG